jgi:hypothetical protein
MVAETGICAANLVLTKIDKRKSMAKRQDMFDLRLFWLQQRERFYTLFRCQTRKGFAFFTDLVGWPTCQKQCRRGNVHGTEVAREPEAISRRNLSEIFSFAHQQDSFLLAERSCQ